MEKENRRQSGEWKQLIRTAALKYYRRVKRNPGTSLLIICGVILFLQIMLLPYDDVRLLKSKNPGGTAFMRDHASLAKKEGKPFQKKQIWIPFKAIPRDAIDAVIVSEDGTFWSHSGFDWFEFRESIERDFEEGRAVRGASTITQQLIKNLYLLHRRILCENSKSGF